MAGMRILRARRSDIAEARRVAGERGVDLSEVAFDLIPGLRDADRHVKSGGRVYVDIVDSDPIGLMPEGWPYENGGAAPSVTTIDPDAIQVAAPISDERNGPKPVRISDGQERLDGMRRKVTARGVKASSLAAKARKRR